MITDIGAKIPKKYRIEIFTSHPYKSSCCGVKIGMIYDDSHKLNLYVCPKCKRRCIVR